jgi:threonine dehydratase
LIRVNTLSERWQAEVYIKCEQFQPIGAFKLRGASNFALQLKKGAKALVTHSSGNHAQAVAFMGRQLGIPAHVVMPSNSNKKKIENAKKWGAEVHLCEPTFESRLSTAEALAEQFDAVIIPPFDHEWIVEGQATCAMEILYDMPEVDIICAPLGGGGLLAGTALAAAYFGKDVQVMGAEPANAADGYEGLKRGERITSFTPNTVADGLRTTVGVVPFEVLKDLDIEVLLAEEDAIIPWMKRMWDYSKTLIEPSCAVPFAAMDACPERWKGKRIAIIVTGGNVDIDQLF